MKPWTIYARMGEQNTDFHYLHHVWDNLREMENQFETVFDPMDKENWITELQDLFAEATARKIQYIRKLTEAKNNAREDAIRQETDRKKREEITRMTENALIKRDTAQAVFDTLYGSTLLALEAEVVPASTVDRLIKQIEDAFTDCKQANSKVLDLADRDAASTAIKWASAIQCRFNEITEKISLHMHRYRRKKQRGISARP